MFDHLPWWQVLAIILPVPLTLKFIQWREFVQSCHSLDELDESQKGYICLHNLPTRLFARVFGDFSPQESKGYMDAGKRLQKHDEAIVAKLLHELGQKLSPEEKVPSKLKDLREYYRCLPLGSAKNIRKEVLKLWPPLAK